MGSQMKILAAIVATAGVLMVTMAGGLQAAEPGHGQARGHLVVTVNGVAQTLAPGQAKQVVADACAKTGETLDVDAVRAAFPAAVTVCGGVTVASQVPVA